MTRKEEETVEALLKLVTTLKSENDKFREDVKSQVEAINKKTNEKHLPITLELEIMRAAQIAVGDSITKVLTSHDSPVIRLVRSVVDENSTQLRQIISDSFKQVIETQEFKNSILNAFSHKVAKTIISNNDGLFDKVSNELKQDAVFKSKMVVAVSNVVNECLNNKI